MYEISEVPECYYFLKANNNTISIPIQRQIRPSDTHTHNYN